MTIEIPATSRFSVCGNPNREPGVCCVCRSPGGDDRQFIDFGMQLDWYGAVYFCTFCVKELAEAAGFVPKDLYLEVKSLSSKLATELNSVEESFRDYRDTTRTLIRDCTCSELAGPNPNSAPSISKSKPAERKVKGDDSDAD